MCHCQRFKASETLLGIETGVAANRIPHLDCFKASETLLGIETDELRRRAANLILLQSL